MCCGGTHSPWKWKREEKIGMIPVNPSNGLISRPGFGSLPDPVGLEIRYGRVCAQFVPDGRLFRKTESAGPPRGCGPPEGVAASAAKSGVPVCAVPSRVSGFRAQCHVTADAAFRFPETIP